MAKVYWFLARPNSKGVHVAIWIGDNLLVIRNSYKSEYSLVCGGIKSNEAPLLAGLREVNEEIGVAFTEDQLQHFGTFESHAEYKHDRCDVYEVRLDEAPEIRLDNREVVEFKIDSLEQIKELPRVDLLNQYIERLED